MKNQRKALSAVILGLVVLIGMTACKDSSGIPSETTSHKHTPVIDVAVSATCTQDGLTAGSHCAVCGEVFVKQETTKAVGHTPVTDAAVPATYAQAGLTEGSHCSVCGEVFVKQNVVLTLPELGYVTEEDTVLESDRFVIHLKKGTYVSADLVDKVNFLFDTIENVTGMEFLSEYALTRIKKLGFDKKVIIKVDILPEDSSHAYVSGNEIHLHKEEIILENGEYLPLIHELLHNLNNRNGSMMSIFLFEGFATYYTEKVLDSCDWFVVGRHQQQGASIRSEMINDPESFFMTAIADTCIEYDFGIRLMRYIDEKHGTDRYLEFVRKYDSATRYENSDVAPMLKEFFGDDFFSDYSAWYSKVSGEFDKYNDRGKNIDISGTRHLASIPNHGGIDTSYQRFRSSVNGSLILDFRIGYMLESIGYQNTFTGEMIVNLSATTLDSLTYTFFDEFGIQIASYVSGSESIFAVPGAAVLVISGNGSLVISPLYEEMFDSQGYGFTVDGFRYKKIAYDELCLIKSLNGGKVTVPQTVIHQGMEYTVTQVYRQFGLPVFSSETTSVTIPGSVRIIDFRDNCNMLEELILSEGIQQFAYYYTANELPSLRSLTIPDSLKCMSFGGYNRAEHLCEYENGVYYLGKWAVGCDWDISELVIRDGTIGIACSAFGRSENIISVYIPDTVKYINSWAFQYCNNLTEISLPSGLICLDGSSFLGCDRLYKEENGVIYIDNWIVGADKTAKQLVLRPDTSGIATGAFRQCEMTSFVVPSGVKAINDSTFEGCYALESLLLPETIEYIGSYVFLNCAKLENIYLPRSLKHIEPHAFLQSAFSDIYYGGTEAEWNGIEKDRAWNIHRYADFENHFGEWTLHYSASALDNQN